MTLKKACYQLLNERPDYAVFDHVSRVERRFYAFLTYLGEQTLPLVIAVRQSGKDSLSHLWMGLYDFDATRTCQLVDHYIAKFHLKIDDPADFKEEVFKVSQGNPCVVQELCRLAGNDRYRAKGYIDVKLMDLDRRIARSMAAADTE